MLFLLAALRGAQKIRTYIDQVIGGELLSVVVCDHCKHVSSMYSYIASVCVTVCVCVRVRVHACLSVCLFVCLCLSVSICLSASVCVAVCIDVCGLKASYRYILANTFNHACSYVLLL